MVKKSIFGVIGIVILVSSFSFIKHLKSEVAPTPADKIFINGTIITVDNNNSIAEAVAVKDGKILAIGTTKEINAYKGKATEVEDLQGKTLIPGFIDGHSHFVSVNKSRGPGLAPPPVGTVSNIGDIVAALQKFKEEHNIKPGEWISGSGYDPDQLEEKRQPTKEDFDKAFPDNPIAITHVSGHMTIANSYALKVSGITASTSDPNGGKIVREKGSNEPTGLLLERAAGLLKRTRPEDEVPLTEEEKFGMLKAREKLYASNGITTAQDGATAFANLSLLEDASEKGVLYIDIEALPVYASLTKVLQAYKYGELKNHLKLNGFKLFADGSPQGKTAFFTDPYLTEVPGCDKNECHGIPTITQEKFNKAIVEAFKNNIQPYVHCNGDAAIDMYIKAVRNANAELNTTSIGRRPVVIHAQFTRPDQLDSYKELGMLPSFFSNHTFFWGDVHIQNLGKERAFFESPLNSALKKGIIFTNHTDFGVTPINQIFLMWTAVNRLSRSGVVVGPDERVKPIDALRAVTINGAYEYFEEATKGSIEKGKLADFAILSANPLTVNPATIKDITVLETIKEGKTIFDKKKD